MSGLDKEILERAKGFEPSTPTLARLCSTPELHPHPRKQGGFAAGECYAKTLASLQRLGCGVEGLGLRRA